MSAHLAPGGTIYDHGWTPDPVRRWLVKASCDMDCLVRARVIVADNAAAAAKRMEDDLFHRLAINPQRILWMTATEVGA